MCAKTTTPFARGEFIEDDDGKFVLVVGATHGNLPVKRIVQILDALDEETRLCTFLSLIEPGVELNVGELCHILGVSQPLLSHHLMLLKGGNILQYRKKGKNNLYSIANREELALLFRALLEALTGRRYVPAPPGFTASSPP